MALSALLAMAAVAAPPAARVFLPHARQAPCGFSPRLLAGPYICLTVSNASALVEAGRYHPGHFRSLHAKRGRLHFDVFHFMGNGSGNGNFWFRMRRSAVDFSHGDWFGLIEKGAAVCSGSQVKLNPHQPGPTRLRLALIRRSCPNAQPFGRSAVASMVPLECPGYREPARCAELLGPGSRSLSMEDEAAKESNLPSGGLHRPAGFEGQMGHRTLATPPEA